MVDEVDTPMFDFDATLAAAQDAWVESLSPFKVWGGTEDQQTRFATALYHTQLMPQILSDEGQYPGFDGENHPDEGQPYYSDFSLWDTYRTTHPLYTLVSLLRKGGNTISQRPLNAPEPPTAYTT
jgi:putative alpha-1,2-mannosidase